MNDETTQDSTDRLAFITGWNLRAIVYATVAFWCIAGAAFAAFLKDWHAFGWSLLATALALALVQLTRWK